MPLFGLTVVAQDATGPHYINHTVRAMTLTHADRMVARYYATSDDEFIEFDQAVELDGDDNPNGPEKIIETMGKIYYDAPSHA